MQKFRLTIGNELSQIEVAVAEVVGPFQISEICVTTRPRRSVERLLLTIKTLLDHFEKCCQPSRENVATHMMKALLQYPGSIQGKHLNVCVAAPCCNQRHICNLLQPDVPHHLHTVSIHFFFSHKCKPSLAAMSTHKCFHIKTCFGICADG